MVLGHPVHCVFVTVIINITCILVIHGVYRNAIADIQIQNAAGSVTAEKKYGLKLPNGSFIFVFDDAPFRRMVLTTNDGVYIRSGYVVIPFTSSTDTWLEPQQWQNASYSIGNFTGYPRGTSGKNYTVPFGAFATRVIQLYS